MVQLQDIAYSNNVQCTCKQITCSHELMEQYTLYTCNKNIVGFVLLKNIRSVNKYKCMSCTCVYTCIEYRVSAGI